MTERTSSRLRVIDRPFHPFLFAILPVLFLVAHNSRLVSMGETVIPAVAALGGAATFYLAFSRLGSGAEVAALRTTVLLTWFFAYGHLARSLAAPMAGLAVDHHFVLLPLWTMGAIVVVVLVGRMRYQVQWTRVVNLVGVGLVGASALALVMGLGSAMAANDRGGVPAVAASGLESDGTPPDIYYLVFDRYAEASSLEDYLGFDNEPFLDALRERGFVVPATSLGNYTNTAMSLASTLSLDYLDWVVDRHGPDLTGQQPLRAVLQEHEIGRVLRSLGYRYLHIGSWWDPTRTAAGADHVYPILRTSELWSILQGSTVLGAPSAWGWFGTSDLPRLHREVAERQFVAVEDAAQRPGPKFVFAHFLLPHPPYVFDAEGGSVAEQPRTLDGRKEAYLAQLRFTNAKVLEMIDAIRGGDGDPIIILQADEGPHPGYGGKGHEDWTTASVDEMRLKFRILNALLLPGADTSALRSTFSSVNTFRVILNEYFGAELDLLPDRSHVSTKARPYRFESVTSEVSD